MRPGRSSNAVLQRLRDAIGADWLADEPELVIRLAGHAALAAAESAHVVDRAAQWVNGVRDPQHAASGLDAFMREYDLSSEEGVLLMCLAEALLRIPDERTAEKLIADKLGSARWEQRLGASESLFVNASTWGLMLTGRLVRLPLEPRSDFRSTLKRLIGRASEPAIRLALRSAMRLMAQQFVMGRDIGEALHRAEHPANQRERHSFDMLGEAAMTAADAERYFAAYADAIERIGRGSNIDPNAAIHDRPGVSVKLSALHPRYEFAQAARVRRELAPRLLRLAQGARQANVGLTVDAEEADRLELSLDVFEAVFRSDSLAGWEGLGLAVQAVQKRAPAVIDWLAHLARDGRRIAVRLVKGAYWDTEIKRAHEQGLSDFPVYTRKLNTDVAWLACARYLLAEEQAIYPMFATHNAHSLSYVAQLGRQHRGWEIQRLHGMGESLHALVSEATGVASRVYAPVGSHEELLPYLVRRLLENGANTSFVNRIHDEQLPAAELVRDPIAQLRALDSIRDPDIVLPYGLFAPRRNSAGINLADGREVAELEEALRFATANFTRNGRPKLKSLIATAAAKRLDPGVRRNEGLLAVLDPADERNRLAVWDALDPASIGRVVSAAVAAQEDWSLRPVAERAAMLEDASDALEARRAEFLHLLVREAGKTLVDALNELRETVDLLRYYALEARRLLLAPQHLPGPAGERNELHLRARGVFACVSPWNFPLAIFGGQIAAALVTGNAAIAKPAGQTPLIALRMVRLLHECGVPREVLQLVLGNGAIGEALIAEPRIAGVVFTGSVAVGQAINRRLAARTGPIATLIAETGGQNAMIADSSALPEQLVRDALRSAFGSAGQRCSALRILYVQDEIADRVIERLRGAMRELVVGDPMRLATDVGPVIDDEARNRLNAHVETLRGSGWLIERMGLPDECVHGSFVAPALAEVPGIEALDEEHFGPILHIARFGSGELDALIERINATGYGLTLGVHTRIESTWRAIAARARVGNIYVNRGMTGAVVGSQPFGGEGLSGTGPKAGGPNYLMRFLVERTVSVNTAAVGGDAGLLAASPPS